MNENTDDCFRFQCMRRVSCVMVCMQRVPADMSGRSSSPEAINVHLYYSPICPMSESGVSAGPVMYMTLKLNTAGQSMPLQSSNSLSSQNVKSSLPRLSTASKKTILSHASYVAVGYKIVS